MDLLVWSKYLTHSLAVLVCVCVCVCALGQHRHVLYDSNEIFLLGTTGEWCRACCVLAKEWMPRCPE